jgi:hypothetical protein
MQNTERNFEVNKNLAIEGFNPNDFARPYDENPDENYLPYDIQRWWFNEVYPNGRIWVSKPEPDAERTPGAYTATAMIWKDKNDEKEDISISNRAVPSEANTVDPYQDCQRKAISLALKTLGFWISPSKVVIKPMVDPEEKGLVNTAITDEKKEEVTPVVSEEPVEAPKKRGRKPKAENEAEVVDNPIETSETPVAVVEEASVVTEAPVVTEVISAPVEKAPAPIESTPVEEAPAAEATMTLEEARATVVNYRNNQGRTIGDLADSKNQKDHELLVWFATSARALKSYKAEADAAKVVLANEK